MTPITFTILGQPYSKANRRRIVHSRGSTRSIKSKEALAYAQDFRRQIPPAARVMWECDVFVVLRIWYETQRPDLDESLILDCLQTEYETVTVRGGHRGVRHVTFSGVILNDRQVRGRLVLHGVDKGNPRACITVLPMESDDVQAAIILAELMQGPR